MMDELHGNDGSCAAGSAAPERLAELIAPISIRTLLDHVEKRHLLHVPSPRRDRFEKLFSWERMNELLARGRIETDRFFLFAGGRQIDPVRLGVLDGSGRVDVSQVRTLFRQGTTISLPNVQATFEETDRLLSDIEWQLGERTELRIIATPSTGTPIPLHFDLPDLLILQVEGEKEWTLFGEPVPGSYRFRSLKEKPSEVSHRVLMRRGDVLFVPSGLHHACQPHGDSLHMVVGIYRRTGMSFVDHVRGLAAEDLAFFDGLPGLHSGEALAEREAVLKRHLQRLIEGASLEDFVRRDDTQRARPRRIALRADVQEPGQLDEALLLPAWSRRLSVPDEGAVQAGARSFHPDEVARAALRLLQEDGAVEARDLTPELDRRFGSGRGAPAILWLIEVGLVVAVRS